MDLQTEIEIGIAAGTAVALTAYGLSRIFLPSIKEITSRKKAEEVRKNTLQKTVDEMESELNAAPKPMDKSKYVKKDQAAVYKIDSSR
ncbi:MAG: hypothetical protein PHS57_01155 [Alphaproteobacteria bacterium]|nr:hypothetical protein [Alphaproteobacteria bacterium]